MIHNLHKSLEQSKQYENAPWWEEVYRKAFSDFLSMQSHSHDGWHQRAGIDRTIMLSSSKVLKIDEKVREKDWGDFLLEYWSSIEHKNPGWIEKDLDCDYIAYAFAPSKTCYLLPFQQLRATWAKHKDEWINNPDYRETRAKNEGYTTIGVAVPIMVVLKSILEAQIITWE